MGPHPSRRALIRTAGACLVLGSSGCVADDLTGGTTETIAESRLSDEAAEEAALAAEKQYLETQLGAADCLNSWGTSGSTVQERAAAGRRTASGVYVDVTSGYWISRQEDDVGDTGSEARYLITPEEAERVEGDSVSPCSD